MALECDKLQPANNGPPMLLLLLLLLLLPLLLSGVPELTTSSTSGLCMICLDSFHFAALDEESTVDFNNHVSC